MSCDCDSASSTSTGPAQIVVGNLYSPIYLSKDANGVLFDPDLVSAKSQAPDGTVTVLTVTKTSVGTYTTSALINQVGLWTIWFYNVTLNKFDTGPEFQAIGLPSGHS